MDVLDLSVIVPIYNEQQNVRPLYEAILAALDPLDLSFEIILADDGSNDDTFEIAKHLAFSDSRVRVIKFRRNYGQTPAMAAGIEHARGRVLVTMDGDLQNDPADIPAFLEKIEEGYDIVAGWRQRRQDKLLTRIVPSKVANWLIAKVTGVPIKDNGCSLKAYRAGLIKNIPLYSEMHRFIPAMTSIAGARIAQIPVHHHARRFGVSKYGLSRVYKVLFDLLTIKTMLIFATRPLFLLTGVAAISAILSAIVFVYDLSLHLAGDREFSVMLLGLSLLLFVLAIFLVSLELLAQLVYRTGTLKAVNLSSLTMAVTGGDGAETGP